MNSACVQGPAGMTGGRGFPARRGKGALTRRRGSGVMIAAWSLLMLSLFLSPGCSTQGLDYNLTAPKIKRVYTGLEVFMREHADRYRGKRIAIVTNHSGVDFDLRSKIGLMREKGIRVVMALAPEHGLFGYQSAYDRRRTLQDDRFGITIYNLHHLEEGEIARLVKKVDAVIFDIQDLGMRCYTYISDLKLVMDAMRGCDTELLVLDRPNPLHFLGVDGPFLDKRFYQRFTTSFPATLVYGMTIGEAALYYQGEYAKNVRLRVIGLKGFDRSLFHNGTMLPWVPPSPNLPTYRSSIVYSAIVLLEGINLSLGRGTSNPFEYIGAPWIDPHSFCEGLRGLGLKSFRFRPVYFKPSASKYRNVKCGGVHIFYIGGRFSPTEVSYRIIGYLKKNYPKFRWSGRPEFPDVDRLSGTNIFRTCIEEGRSWEDFSTRVLPGMRKFEQTRNRYLLY